mmetsp:Transcript_150248/g.381875  ORF Transcript_150248/g.381875 Transcript_150248/m.381875 type:complete len:219 (-) Transcript_150248:1121-1777(-)
MMSAMTSPRSCSSAAQSDPSPSSGRSPSHCSAGCCTQASLVSKPGKADVKTPGLRLSSAFSKRSLALARSRKAPKMANLYFFFCLCRLLVSACIVRCSCNCICTNLLRYRRAMGFLPFVSWNLLLLVLRLRGAPVALSHHLLLPCCPRILINWWRGSVRSALTFPACRHRFLCRRFRHHHCCLLCCRRRFLHEEEEHIALLSERFEVDFLRVVRDVIG